MSGSCSDFLGLRLCILVPQANHPERIVFAAEEVGILMQGLNSLRDFSPLFVEHHLIQFVCERADFERAFFLLNIARNVLPGLSGETGHCYLRACEVIHVPQRY